jgi:hypothetical protein
VDLKPIFIPGKCASIDAFCQDHGLNWIDVLIRTHEESTLKSWCAQHIKRWGRTAIEIKMEFIWGLPPLECEVYEFEPKTNELLRQFQYCYNEETGGRDRIEKFSPPLGMVQIERADRNRYEKYLDMIVDKYMDQFAGRCYFDEKDDFMVRLLRLMVHYEPEKAEEVSDDRTQYIENL